MEVSNITTGLTNVQQQWVSLRVGSKESKSLSEIDLKRQCALIIKRAFDYSTPNSVTDEQVLTAQTLELFTILKGKYGTLTIPEVKVAFKNGLDGVYCPYFGLCGKTYNQFLKGFYEDVNRGKAWLAYLENIDKENVKEMTPSEKLQVSKEGAIARFEHYKKTGELGFIPSATYNILNDLIGVEYEHPVLGKVKTLVTDKEARIRIYKEVKTWYVEGMNKQKTKATYRKDFDMVKDIEYLINNFDKQKAFENEVKDKMLAYYFDELINQNKKLDI